MIDMIVAASTFSADVARPIAARAVMIFFVRPGIAPTLCGHCGADSGVFAPIFGVLIIKN